MSVGNLKKRNYYSMSGGLVVRQFKEATEFSKTRINKNGKTVHEEFYEYISGIITGITTKESPEFGRFWIITMNDDGDEFILQLNYSSGYTNAFLKCLPNVDLKKKVQLIPKVSIEDGGKKKATMFVNQGGKAIKWFYTKDNPNGIPELKSKPGKGAMKGKTIWDDSDIMEFLEEMVTTKIVPQLPKPEVEEDIKPDAAAADQTEDAPF